MAADSSPGMTLTDVLERYGQHWQIEAAEFCYVAVRRPTPTRQEIVPAEIRRNWLSNWRPKAAIRRLTCLAASRD
jgi:hypothetical protein